MLTVTQSLTHERTSLLQRLVTLNKLASPKAMLVRNSDPPTDRLNGVKCRAISVINKKLILLDLLSSLWDWLGLDRGQKLHVVNSKSQKWV